MVTLFGVQKMSLIFRKKDLSGALLRFSSLRILWCSFSVCNIVYVVSSFLRMSSKYVIISFFLSFKFTANKE